MRGWCALHPVDPHPPNRPDSSLNCARSPGRLREDRGVSLDLSPADLSRAFGRDVSSYEIEAIDPHLRIHSVTGGVYRVRVDEQSCVIKVVRHGVDATADGLWQSGADVNHRN